MKDDQTIDALRRAGERLRAAIHAEVMALPADARSISAMSRLLQVHKATCQRVVEGLTERAEALEGLARLPGLAALKTHTEACQRVGVPEAVVAEARTAIEEYATLLRRRGLTHEKVRRMAMSSRDRAEEGALAQKRRKALFDAAAMVTGEQADAKAVAMLICPGKTSATTEMVALVSLLKAEREEFARPLTMLMMGGWWTRVPGAEAEAKLPPEVRGSPSYELIQELSTAPVKTVTLDSGAARSLVLIEGTAGTPADATVMFRTSGMVGGTSADSPLIATGARVTIPMRSLLVDVLVHRDLRVGPSAAGCYSLAAPPGDRAEGRPDQLWHERLADVPQVREFDPSNPPRPLAAVDESLVQRVLAAGNVHPSQVRAYRLEVRYPIWQSEYRVYFARGEAASRYRAEPSPQVHADDDDSVLRA